MKWMSVSAFASVTNTLGKSAEFVGHGTDPDGVHAGVLDELSVVVESFTGVGIMDMVGMVW
jgi:hypothetical protein